MRKTAFWICKNKGAEQLRGKRQADQRPCLHYLDTTIPLLSKAEISRGFYPSSVPAQPRLCWTCSKTRMLLFS